MYVSYLFFRYGKLFRLLWKQPISSLVLTKIHDSFRRFSKAHQGIIFFQCILVFLIVTLFFISNFLDKAGGNKFAKDFEDGSLKLQEFVTFLENELKTGPPLLEALGNADIFYEMQYKEVKIVANVSVLCWCKKIEIVMPLFH